MGIVDVKEDLVLLEERIHSLVHSMESIKAERNSLLEENETLQDERNAIRSQLSQIVDRLDHLTTESLRD